MKAKKVLSLAWKIITAIGVVIGLIDASWDIFGKLKLNPIDMSTWIVIWKCFYTLCVISAGYYLFKAMRFTDYVDQLKAGMDFLTINTLPYTRLVGGMLERDNSPEVLVVKLYELGFEKIELEKMGFSKKVLDAFDTHSMNIKLKNIRNNS